MSDDVKRRFFSGDSLQQALVQAANYFNLDPSYVNYKSLEKRHGFLKTRRKVVIEVDPENPRLEKPAALPAAERSVPPPPPSSYLTREPSAPRPEGADAPPAHEQEPRPPREPRREGGGEREARPAGAGGGGRERRERRDDRGPRGGDRGGRGDRGDRGGRPRRDRDRGDAPRVARRPEWAREDAAPVVGEGGELVTLPERPRGLAERYPVATGPVAEAAVKAADLLIRIAGLDLKAQAYQGAERIEVDLAGDDADWCFQDDGELLMSIEHLLPRMIRSLSGEGEVPALRVDCDNFHEIREERLRSLAQRMAEEVRRTGRPRVLEPMNPADRRIVHVTLADDPQVATESEGDGYFKRVMIRPAAE